MYNKICYLNCPANTEINNEECKSKSLKIIYPEEYYNNKENCKAIFENKCFQYCPDGTCLTQNDPSLLNCIPMNSDIKVFNNICFENFDTIIENIKSMAENDEIISTDSGIIIKGYSTSSENNLDSDAKYSLVYLGDCENKLREYYKSDENIELFILGIDSPSKDGKASTNVYNYGVYLRNGTQLDHENVCKDTKITISSVITNIDLIKLEEEIAISMI